MAWMHSTQIINLYIEHYANGTVTYIDENGQSYIPFASQVQQDMHVGIDSGSSVINMNVSLEELILFSSICLALIILGGITSGLNVALLGLDAKKSALMLKLSEKNSSLISSTKLRMMERLQPLINDRHLLLVTLLVANASCMEALPIFLDELVSSWLAIVISVTFVLIFGEILPQALFTADPLRAGYKLYYVVLAMKWLFYPICKPLALLLDAIFHASEQQKGVVFTPNEVNMIMEEIQQHPDERTVVEGALMIANYTVMESIMPWDEVICLDANTKLDARGLRNIYKTGFSRIPIYEDQRHNIVGILLVKTLILCDPDPRLTLREYLTKNFKKIPMPALVSPKTPLYDTINLFQEQKTHFAMVCEENDEMRILECWRDQKPIPDDVDWCGIITLEDIMEDIIQEEIVDEFDDQNPLQAIMESVLHETDRAEPTPWTDDHSFVESVKSRFNAKNKRTYRAMQTKTHKQSKAKPDDLVLLSTASNPIHLTPGRSVQRGPHSDTGSPLPFFEPYTKSNPTLLEKPLLAHGGAINLGISIHDQQVCLPPAQSSPVLHNEDRSKHARFVYDHSISSGK